MSITTANQSEQSEESEHLEQIPEETSQELNETMTQASDTSAQTESPHQIETSNPIYEECPPPPPPSPKSDSEGQKLDTVTHSEPEPIPQPEPKPQPEEQQKVPEVTPKKRSFCC